jgi:serine/threonine protein kinase
MQLSAFKDKYTILEKVEEGSYGVIYKARNNLSKEIVAVKKFKTLNKVGLPISFVRERYIFEILNSKHLVKVMETFIGEEEPMMVMEWLTTNLDKIVSSKKKFAIKEVFYEILKGA